MNETHDVTLASWLPSAHAQDCDFPLQNLPIGVFRRRASDEPLRGGVAIGDQIVDLPRASELFDGLAAEAAAVCAAPSLNAYLALGTDAWSALRLALSRALRKGSALERPLSRCLVPQAQAELALPISVGDYTDFYASVHHATRVGLLFRPDQPLMPNYTWLPVAYHGRSSSVVVSGTEVRRPYGQTKPPTAFAPSVTPTARLDYELELGVVVGPGNPLGARVPLERAESHVYGLCLLNDWSARDIQAWEYQPLGPFAGKNFATTLSPWLVSLEALEPFRAPWSRAAEDTQPLAYLDGETNTARGALDIQVETRLWTAAMRQQGLAAQTLARTSFCDAAYWTIAQMIAHHTLNGCALRPGDLLGTGTLSGPASEQAGCLLELSQSGKQPLTLHNGETRTFLQDGDVLSLHAWCAREGAARIGFGSATGLVLPAHPLDD
jgi:fumarylacetoacetase